jgi:hypothetical protein
MYKHVIITNTSSVHKLLWLWFGETPNQPPITLLQSTLIHHYVSSRNGLYDGTKKEYVVGIFMEVSYNTSGRLKVNNEAKK